MIVLQQQFPLLLCVSVPWKQYQPTKGVDGVRVDREKRPELHMGSYEMLSAQKVGGTSDPHLRMGCNVCFCLWCETADKYGV